MQIISVIPIQKGIPFDNLTYFSADPIPEGYLVKVSIQSKEVTAVVVGSQPLSDAKVNVKASAFALKKVLQIIGPGSIDAPFIAAATKAARRAFVPLGAFLGELLPAGVLEQRQYAVRSTTVRQKQNEPILVQGQDESRLDTYKSAIRDAIGKGECVLFVAPTIALAETWFEYVSKGIEKRSYLLHSDKSKTEQRRIYKELFQAEKGMLLVATPHFSVIPWFEPAVTILDHLSHIGYQSRSRYDIDYRDLLMSLHTLRGATVYGGDHIIPFRYLWESTKDIRTFFPRSYAPQKLQVLDISKEPFATIPQEIIVLAKHVAATEKKLFVYTHRKGIAPYSVCRTCKTVVACTECSSALVLRYSQKNGERVRTFVCPECGHTEPANYTCAHCGSWNIEPQEIGSDAVSDAFRDLHLSIPIIIIDSDQGDAAVIREKIETTPSAIIIGTDRALEFLNTVHFSVVPHFDRLLGRTTLDAGERALRLLYTLDEKTADTVVLVTRNKKQAVIEALEKRELAKYVEAEASVARALGYPPFGVILKISVRCPDHERAKAIELITLAAKPLTSYLISTKRTRPGAAYLTLTFMLKAGKSFFEPGFGHYEHFLENLSSIPYRPTIETDPQSLL